MMEQKYRDVVAAFGADPRVRIHRTTSEDALSSMPDASLDWVYVDGNHNEPLIGRDLELCLAKVKPEVITAGDDVSWQATAKRAPVRRAVDAVVAKLDAAVRFKLIGNQFPQKLRRSGAGLAAAAAG